MINASNNPFSCEPAVIGLNNQILELGTISRVDDTFTFSVGFKWEINSQIFQNTITFDYTPAAATTGYKRIDIAVLNTNNEIEFLAGTESDTIALRPTIPLNNLLLTQWNIDAATIGDSETPLVGSEYVEKSFASSYAYPSITGTDAVIPLPANGASTIIVNNSSLISIAGFDLSLITGNPNAKVPYLGKEYTLENQTNNNITLKHLSSVAIEFFALDKTDLIIPPGKSVRFNYGGSQVKETFKNWNSQKYKTISSNTTLDNTFHNAIVWVIGNCNITIPSDLRSDFACTLRTFSGVTATYLTSGTTINAESDGSTQAESSMVLIATYSTNNFILSGGGLS